MDFSVNFTRCKDIVTHLLKARLVPCIESAPGMGKSAMAKQIAEDLDLFLVDVRLSTIDQTELNGFAAIQEKLLADGTTTKVASYLPMDIWPIEGTPLPLKADGTPYKGWLILLDELRSATPDTQAAAYRLLLDREVGNKKLHQRVAVMAATNGTDHNAVAYDAGTAMQSRIVWLSLKSDLDDWVDMAQRRGFDNRVIAFLNWKGISALNNFTPDGTESNFGCERTWEAMSKSIKAITSPDIPMLYLPMLVGVVGQSLAMEFQAFTQIYTNLDTFQAVIANPTGVKVDNSRPDILYAMVARIQSEIDPATIANFIDPLMVYVNRLPLEFQSMIVKTILIKAPQMQVSNPSVQGWVQTKASYLVNKQQQIAAQPLPPKSSKDDDDDDQP
jgi:hypothetical protein